MKHCFNLTILTYLVLLSVVSTAQNSRKWEKAIKYTDKKMGFSYMEGSDRYSNDPNAYSQDIPLEAKPTYFVVDSFFISKYEVSNADYQEFLKALSADPKLEEQIMPYEAAYPLDSNWKFTCFYDHNHDVFLSYYFENNRINWHRFPEERREYYERLPQVNITYEQAVNFCKWKTLTYNTDPKRKFKQVLFRLPTKLEWEYAAQDGIHYMHFPLHFDCINEIHNCSSEPFDENGKLRCNFNFTVPGMIYVDTTWRIIDTIFNGNAIYDSVPKIKLERYWNKWHQHGHCGLNLPKYLLGDIEYNDGVNTYFPMLPVETFGPQHGGLYQMAGNVREMVQEKGLTKGGSWRLPFIYNYVRYTYNDYRKNYADIDLGFRLVMEIIEY